MYVHLPGDLFQEADGLLAQGSLRESAKGVGYVRKARDSLVVPFERRQRVVLVLA